jgi:hypothetical protein
MLGQIAPNPRSYEALVSRVAQLSAENEKLQAQLAVKNVTSMFTLKDKTFLAATSFASAQVCLQEAAECGALEVLGTLERNKVEPSTTFLEEQTQALQKALPGLEGEIDEALARCLERAQKKPKKGDGRGAKTRIDVEHLFLIPFLYMVGGFQQWTAPMLDGIRCSQQHFSRLLAISTPVVVDRWARQYYQPRNIAWLKQFCPPRPQDAEGAADCTLFYDGSKYEVERSGGLREQRMTWSAVEDCNLLQFIGVTNEKGWFVDATAWAGGHMKESDMVWTLDLWDRINKEAQAMGETFWIHLIVDRGFRDNRATLREMDDTEDWPWPWLDITCEVVHHLGTKEEPDRTQHPPEEVEDNRKYQGRRWVNEKAFAFFDISRFFRRVIECTSVASMQLFKQLNLGIANYRMGTPKAA